MGLKPKTFVVLQRAIEEGVARGYRRAHKHTDTPEESAICTSIEEAVMGEICEVFDFDDKQEEETG